MFEKEAERKIREAIERGELEDYPGKGKPFPEEFWEQNAYVPEDLQLSYKIFKNASILPPEIQLKARIEELRTLLHVKDLSESDRAHLLTELQDKELQFNVKLESFRSLSSRK